MSRLEQLQRLAASAPNDPMTHYGVGLELVNLREWADAATAFQRAIDADANYSAAYFHRGRALLQASQVDDARATLAAGLVVARRQGDMKTVGELQDLMDSLD